MKLTELVELKCTAFVSIHRTIQHDTLQNDVIHNMTLHTVLYLVETFFFELSEQIKT